MGYKLFRPKAQTWTECAAICANVKRESAAAIIWHACAPGLLICIADTEKEIHKAVKDTLYEVRAVIKKEGEVLPENTIPGNPEPITGPGPGTIHDRPMADPPPSSDYKGIPTLEDK